MKSSNKSGGLTAILEALSHGTLAQSLILVGPEEVQQEALQVLIPQLLCEETNGSSGSCRSCHTAWPSHPDLMEMVQEGSTIRLDEAHRVVSALSARPLWSPHKVVVIRPADRLGREAESYLLKHLEEPPGYVYYLLLTERPDQLLATIRSRCQIWRLGHDSFAAATDVGRTLWQETLTPERVVSATYWARHQYRNTGGSDWLHLWGILADAYRQLEANGNADLVLAQIRRAWPTERRR